MSRRWHAESCLGCQWMPAYVLCEPSAACAGGRLVGHYCRLASICQGAAALCQLTSPCTTCPCLPLAALCLSPDGRGVAEAHVKLPTELLSAFPAPAGDDARYLEEIAQRDSLDHQ